jgi:ATP-dependent helicase/nuclease subunit B
MSLEIVAGGSGAGKSYTVYKELIDESIRHPERDYIVIVPEQFTMQTQKDLVTMHPRHGLLNVDVLSFNRLAWRVFSETGGDTRPVLGDLGKSLVLQRVVSACGDDLTVLGGTMRKQGSIEEMKSLISELLQYRVKPEKLEEWLDTDGAGGGLLSHKVADIRLIYGKFMDYLSSCYLTTEEVPELLCGVIDDSRLVKGSTVVLDGFTGFTPVQLLVVGKLLSLCRRVTCIVTADPGTDLFGECGRHRLFYMSCRMTRQIARLAREERCEILPVRWIRGSARFADNAPLRFLEQHILRYPKKEYGEETDRIRIREAADPSDEIRYVTAEILRLIRTGQYRYRDFAVVSGDLPEYGRECRRQFEAEKIPYFLDQKKSVLENPLVEFIRSAVDMIVKGFSYESVFRFLRSALADFQPEEIDRMENYVIANGIRGWKRYEEEWTRVPKHSDASELQELNAIRERFVSLLFDFTEEMRKRNMPLSWKAETLYRFLVKNDLQRKLIALAERFEEAGDEGRAKEYRQVYEEVLAVLDKMVEILGGEKMGNAAFLKLLEAGFSESSIGLIPPGEDQVMVGDLTRTRLKKIKVLFLVGVNEGIVPKSAKADGLLSETDRAALSSGEIHLAPDSREELASQRFYLYLVQTKASDRLFLSYSRTGASGAALAPSYLIHQVRSVFPKVRVESGDGGFFHQLETREGVLDALLLGIRTPGNAEEERRFVEIAADEPELFGRLATAARTHNVTDGIGDAAAQALYGPHADHSASRLETFAKCAFRHFMQYGIRAAEREEYVFTPADLGTVVHASLERFTRGMVREGLTWDRLTDTDRERLSDEALDSYLRDAGGSVLLDTERNTYEIGRIRRILRRTTWALRQQMEPGSFVTESVEHKFRKQIGPGLVLTGKIDRIDVCDDGGDRYVKIIDYKTGKVQFDLPLLYHGISLQLMLYMDAALSDEQERHPDKRTLPGGMFYYRIDDPFTDPASAAPAEEQILKMLKMNGLALADDHALTLLDRGLSENGTASTVVGVKRNKDGALAKGSQAASAEEFQALRKFVRGKTGELANRVRQGETAALPYRYGTEDGCAYCPYGGICGYDERIPGYRHRLLGTVTMDTILKQEQDGGK